MFKNRRRPLDDPPPAWAMHALMLFGMLAMFLPLGTAIAISTWSQRLNDVWLDHMGWSFLLSGLIFFVPLIIWSRRRSYWTICWYWFGSLIMLCAYLPCLAIAAAVPLGWRESGVPNGEVEAVLGLIFVLVCLPLCWGPYRLLTLRYFQPWTTPDQWEPGVFWSSEWQKAFARRWHPWVFAEVERKRVEHERRITRAQNTDEELHKVSDELHENLETPGLSTRARILLFILFGVTVLRVLLELLRHAPKLPDPEEWAKEPRAPATVITETSDQATRDRISKAIRCYERTRKNGKLTAEDEGVWFNIDKVCADADARQQSEAGQKP